MKCPEALLDNTMKYMFDLNNIWRHIATSFYCWKFHWQEVIDTWICDMAGGKFRRRYFQMLFREWKVFWLKLKPHSSFVEHYWYLYYFPRPQETGAQIQWFLLAGFYGAGRFTGADLSVLNPNRVKFP